MRCSMDAKKGGFPGANAPERCVRAAPSAQATVISTKIQKGRLETCLFPHVDLRCPRLACLTPSNAWHRWVAAPKVVTDQLLWGPLWNAIYIWITGALKRDSFETIWEAITSTAVPLIVSGLKLWPAAHLVTYGL